MFMSDQVLGGLIFIAGALVLVAPLIYMIVNNPKQPARPVAIRKTVSVEHSMWDDEDRTYNFLAMQ